MQQRKERKDSHKPNFILLLEEDNLTEEQHYSILADFTLLLNEGRENALKAG